MTDRQRNATVLDTTVLSNFAQVNHVDVVLQLPRCVTVDAVREELEAGATTHGYLDNALTVLGSDLPVLTPSSTAAELEKQLLQGLDPGEAQALAVAETLDGTLVTDDGDARTMANRRDVRVTGSIGLLVRFVDDGALSVGTADEYLKRWIDEAGFRSPARDVDVFLED